MRRLPGIAGQSGGSASVAARPGRIVETKLHLPVIRPEWVDRPALVRYLDQSQARLILVDAPAGYGKTTLLAQWGASAAASGRPFGWVSLDRGDNDPQRLWVHIVSALQRACPVLTEENLVRPLRVQSADIEGTLIPNLVNGLAALDEQVILVLDDYHLINQADCHRQLDALLTRLPPPATVVLSTRADPPLPLARMRASGEMAEVRMQQLRFEAEQAAVLIRSVAELDLAPRDLAELASRTEGWPAGVVLAALSLRGRADPANFVRRFTGSNRHIADLLTQEVVSRQPPDVQRFLLHTSMLTKLCAPLCDAVTGTGDAQEVIKHLERENLFVIPLDDDRLWFRYHQLFAQMLVSQLKRGEPGVLPVLHQRASDWFGQIGAARLAVEHALAAGNACGAVNLIAANWTAYVDAGRVATVRQWLRSLGDLQISASPLAAHCAAWVAALSGERDDVRRWIPIIEAGQHQGRLPDGMQSLQSSALLLKATFGFSGLTVMRESAARAVELEDDVASPWHALARTVLGMAMYLSGELDAAAGQLDQALASVTPIAVVRLFALVMRTLIAVELGRLDEAQAAARAAGELAADPALGLGNSPQGWLASLAAGSVQAGYGRLAQARAHYDRFLSAREPWPGLSPWPKFEVQVRLADVLLELGDRRCAAEQLEAARNVISSFPDGTSAQRRRLDRLAQRLDGRPKSASLAEPLTEREEGILRLLRGTLSQRQIGQELHLSANTIKTHTRAIYRKLGVRARGDAVARGRELGMFLAARLDAMPRAACHCASVPRSRRTVSAPRALRQSATSCRGQPLPCTGVSGSPG